MRIINETKLDFDSVLIMPKRSTLSSRKDVDLNRTFNFKYFGEFSGIPIMAANMDTVGTIKTAKILSQYSMFTCFHKFIQNDDDFDQIKDIPFYMFSPTVGFKDKLDSWKFGDFKYICLDVANGYTEKFVNLVKRTRNDHPDKTIITGNVCTPEMTEELILAGADIVKIGIGPGSGCLTRQKSGVGYPQLSAIIECADAAHGLGGHIIADGGCRYPSDIAKAFGAGADFVMVGGMFAGHDENSVFDEEGNSLFYGMSSSEAMKKHYGKIDSHRTSEGRVVKLKSKGSLHHTIQDILGGLRSTCTYVGATSLKQLSKRTTFIRVDQQLNQMYAKNTISD